MQQKQQTFPYDFIEAMTTLGQSCKRVLRNSPSIKIRHFLNKKTHVESRFIKASGGQPLDYHKGASSELCQFRSATRYGTAQQHRCF